MFEVSSRTRPRLDFSTLDPDRDLLPTLFEGILQFRVDLSFIRITQLNAEPWTERIFGSHNWEPRARVSTLAALFQITPEAPRTNHLLEKPHLQVIRLPLVRLSHSECQFKPRPTVIFLVSSADCYITPLRRPSPAPSLSRTPNDYGRERLGKEDVGGG